jgi:Tfp pilus assembly protein FimT
MRNDDRSGRPAGFSVVELVVVAAIIIIGAAVATPAIIEYVRTARIRGGASEVAAEMQRARNTAVMKNLRSGVVFSIENDARGEPIGYRYYIPDGIITPQDAASIGAASGNKGQTLDRTAILSSAAVERVQAGYLRRLPERIRFSAAACGLAPNASAIRFTRLGAVCQPVGATGPCPAFVSGSGTDYIQFDASGNVRLCVEDNSTHVAWEIQITPGGRVRSAEAGRLPTPTGTP